MSKRKSDLIYIITPDDERQFVSLSYIQRILGINEMKLSIYNLKDQITKLERKLSHIETPYRIGKLIELLFKDDIPHTLTWFRNRIPDLKLSDLELLHDAGKLETIERGTHTLYYLRKEDEVDTSIQEASI